MSLKAFAPAKINLFLHVGPLGTDGYHPLSSWMVFADVGDEVELILDSTGLGPIVVEGPFAAAAPADDSNLAVRAQSLWLDGLRADSKVGLRLTKTLPAAAGLGGGSSDAAAVLRLMNQYGQASQADLEALGAGLGADVPACVRGESLIATGRGEALASGPSIAPIPAVLVNPGVDCPTAAVFKAYDENPTGGADLPALPDGFMSVRAVAKALATYRNDLEAPARRLRPVIGEVLDALAASPQTLIARMSGSGASCFALCADVESAASLAEQLSAAHPNWWIRACRLGGPWPDDFTNL